jgi:hypothetical protein
MLLGSVLAAWVGCAYHADDPPISDPGDPPDPTITIEFEVELGEEIATVAFVTGSIDADGCEQASIALQTDDGIETEHPATIAGNELSATLIGLKADTEYTIEISASLDGTDHRSDPQTFVTGYAPSSIPDMNLTEHADGSERTGFLVTSVIKTTSMAIILDQDLDMVWWHVPEAEECVISRVVLTRDRSSVLYLVELPADETTPWKNELVRVSLDGTEMSRQRVDGAHHDFVELPDGTVALLTRDERLLDGEPVIADAIVELLPSGDELTVWSAWDDFLPDPDWADQLIDANMGWSHANALDYDEATDSYLVGLRALDAIVSVSRDSGELQWQVGGELSDYQMAQSAGKWFAKQHQFELLDGGLLLFDNGHTQDYDSRVVEYSLEPETGEAVESWSYHAHPALYSPVLGDVMRTRDGGTLITWGAAGLLHEVSPDGELRWSLALDYGGGLGYTTPVDKLPDP